MKIYLVSQERGEPPKYKKLSLWRLKDMLKSCSSRQKYNIRYWIEIREGK